MTCDGDVVRSGDIILSVMYAVGTNDVFNPVTGCQLLPRVDLSLF